MYPPMAYMGAVGSTADDREWTVLDVLRAARNALCGIALGNWQEARASTAEDYWRGYVAQPTLLSPEPKVFDRRVRVWTKLSLMFSHPSTAPTETRA